MELSQKIRKQDVEKPGGFLPMMVGLAMGALFMIAKAILSALDVGALSGLGSAVIFIAVGSGLYLKRRGKVSCVDVRGNVLHIKPSTA